jgi:hypothetical protein
MPPSRSLRKKSVVYITGTGIRKMFKIPFKGESETMWDRAENTGASLSG